MHVDGWVLEQLSSKHRLSSKALHSSMLSSKDVQPPPQSVTPPPSSSAMSKAEVETRACGQQQEAATREVSKKRGQ